jgi:hypothetical protein
VRRLQRPLDDFTIGMYVIPMQALQPEMPKYALRRTVQMLDEGGGAGRILTAIMTPGYGPGIDCTSGEHNVQYQPLQVLGRPAPCSRPMHGPRSLREITPSRFSRRNCYTSRVRAMCCQVLCGAVVRWDTSPPREKRCNISRGAESPAVTGRRPPSLHSSACPRHAVQAFASRPVLPLLVGPPHPGCKGETFQHS